jgi:HrpA-like RNA helicase
VGTNRRACFTVQYCTAALHRGGVHSPTAVCAAAILRFLPASAHRTVVFPKERLEYGLRNLNNRGVVVVCPFPSCRFGVYRCARSPHCLPPAMSSVRAVQQMMEIEAGREKHKAKQKLKAAADAARSGKDAPRGHVEAHMETAIKQNPALALKTVLSADSAQRMLSATALAPAAKSNPPQVTAASAARRPVKLAVAPRPFIIADDDPRKKPQKQQKKGNKVTLDQSQVQFSEELMEEMTGKRSGKCSSVTSEFAMEATSSLPAPAVEDQNMKDASESESKQASVKQLKHRRFRAGSDAAAPASENEASLDRNALFPDAPRDDPFAPSRAGPLSKAEQKKLRKLAEAKAKKAQRVETMKMLLAAQTALKPEQQKLLISTTKVGQKATLREQLRREFKERKAGIIPATGEEDGEAPAGASDSRLLSSFPRPKPAEITAPTAALLDFFASTISPHIHPPKAKVSKPVPQENKPAAGVKFGDDFGAFRSSALTSVRKRGSDEDSDASDAAAEGRGYVAGYIQPRKHTMTREIQRRKREEEEEEEEEEDEEEEEEEEDPEQSAEEGVNEDEEMSKEEAGEEEGEPSDEEEEDEEEEEESAPTMAPQSNLYSVAFAVQPIRANKKKRKRVALALPGLAAAEQEANESEEEAEEKMEDEGGSKAEDEQDEPEESEDQQVSSDEEQKSKRKKSKKSSSPASQPAEEPKVPKLKRSDARVANQAVQLATSYEAGKKFSRSAAAGPSDNWREILAEKQAAAAGLKLKPETAEEKSGGTVVPYPGTESLIAPPRVSYNDMFLGDREAGASVVKPGARAKPQGVEKPPVVAQAKAPTLRKTPGGRWIVEVHRDPSLAAARLALPVLSQEQEIMELISSNDVVILSGETGSGKCWGRGTRLLMYSGEVKPVEEIQEGEQLMGDDGRPRTVKPGSVIRGTGEMFRVVNREKILHSSHIKEEDGWECNADHILVLRLPRRPFVVKFGRGEYRVLTYEVAPGSSEESEVPIACFAEDAEVSYRSHAEAIAIAEKVNEQFRAPLEFHCTVRDYLSIPPETRRKLRMFQPDKVEFAPLPKGCSLAERLQEVPMPNSRHPEVRLQAAALALGKYFGAGNVPKDTATRRLLSSYCVSTPLHGLPFDLLVDTLEVRRWLLAGILTAHDMTQAEMRNFAKDALANRARRDAVCLGVKGDDAAESICFLARSLGVTAKKEIRPVDVLSHNNNRHPTDLVILGGAALLHIPSFSSFGDAEQLSHRILASELRRGCFDIVPVGRGEFFGFTLAGADGRCLLARDFTVTHNTTQVPQMLFEAGYGLAQTGLPGLIGVTEPRRVAAIATAKRVAQELNVWNPEEASKLKRKAQKEKEKARLKSAGSDSTDATLAGEEDGVEDMTLVSYQVRYVKFSSAATRIKFMTDGILLREAQSDFLLSRYSVVIIDEAHERSISTDILVGILSRVVPLRNKMARKYAKQKSEIEEKKELSTAEREIQLAALKPVFPIKLIIMSATLRLDDFIKNTRLFPSPKQIPPVLSVQSRQFPVTTHFHRFTPLKDWETHALKMVLKMHAKLPMGRAVPLPEAEAKPDAPPKLQQSNGGILVFLTGKHEIDVMVAKLRKIFAEKTNREQRKKIDLTSALARAKDTAAASASPAAGTSFEEINDPENPVFNIDISSDEEAEEEEKDRMQAQRRKQKHAKQEAAKRTQKTPEEKKQRRSAEDDDERDEEDEDDAASEDEDRHADFSDDGGDADMMEAADEEGASSGKSSRDIGSEGPRERLPVDPEVLESQLRELADSATSPVVILPLYSLLPTEEQMRIFGPVPAGHRLIVLSTNVAETSLTIPGISYVLDCGREKTKVYDKISGTSAFKTEFISQASAAQRAGRSGRTGPGHAYRLYSGAVFDTLFPKFAPPEILRSPIEGTILAMKSMGLPDLRSFPFPTPPQKEDLNAAYSMLQALGALTISAPSAPSAASAATSAETEESSVQITELGRILSTFPVHPRFGKMLILAMSSRGSDHRHTAQLLGYMIRVVALLSVEQLWITPNFGREAQEKAEKQLQEEEEQEAEEGEEEGEEEMDESDEPHADKKKVTKHSKKGKAHKKKSKRPNADGEAEETGSDDREARLATLKSGIQRELQRGYNSARARWLHSSSDVLGSLRAVGAYEHVLLSGAGKGEQSKKQRESQARRAQQFLRENFMRPKAVEEILALQKQLTQIAAEMLQFNVDAAATSKSAKPREFDPTVANAAAEEAADAAETVAAASSLDSAAGAAASSSSASASAVSSPHAVTLEFLRSGGPLPPPTDAQERALLQILVAGLIDHVARRMSPQRKQGLLEAFRARVDLTPEEESQGLDLSGAYECVLTPEPVFIHPGSVLFAPESQPEYLVYSDLMRTKKTYMRGLTALPDTRWLEKFGAGALSSTALATEEDEGEVPGLPSGGGKAGLLTFGPLLLSNPAPIYDADKDAVMAYRDAKFGPNLWELPRSLHRMPKGLDRTRNFLRLFLSASVCPKLKPFVPFLLFKPAAFAGKDLTIQNNKSYTKLLTAFVTPKNASAPAAVQASVDCLRQLERAWDNNPQFFLQEYLSWIQSTQHEKVKKIWPPRAEKEANTAKTHSTKKQKA